MRCVIHISTLLPFRIGVVFFSLSTLKHLSIQKGIEGLKANYTDGLKAAYCYWPFVLFGMYALMPPLYRNLWFDSFNFLWAVLISYLANRVDLDALNKQEEDSDSFNMWD